MEDNQVLGTLVQSLVKDLLDRPSDLNNLRSSNQEVNESAECNELATALSKAQSEFKVAEKNKKNPFFKSNYADFQSIVAASRPALTKNGLAILQKIIAPKDDDQILVTKLLHSSGQWTQSTTRILPLKSDVQSFSSYITYIKRIAYASLVGVVAGDEDDDGEGAVRPSYDMNPAVRIEGMSTLPQFHTPANTQGVKVTREQLEELEYELDGYQDITTMVLDGLKIKTLGEMPKNKYMSSAQRIREIKNQRNSIK